MSARFSDSFDVNVDGGTLTVSARLSDRMSLI